MYVEAQIQREMAAYLGNKLVQMGTKIVGVGRNYAAHAKELGNALPSEPLLFLKPTSSYVREGMAIEIPHPCTALDHEVELGVVIGKKGRDIPQHAAMDHISGTPFTLALSTLSNPSIICLHVFWCWNQTSWRAQSNLLSCVAT